MSGDLEEAVRMLAADNARMCDIIIAADELAEAVAEQPHAPVGPRPRLLKALEKYRIVRQGQ